MPRTRPLGKHALTLWTQKNADEVVRDLGELYSEKLDVENAITNAVARARKLGLSWETIGRELNMSKQAAWERWRQLDPPS